VTRRGPTRRQQSADAPPFGLDGKQRTLMSGGHYRTLSRLTRADARSASHDERGSVTSCGHPYQMTDRGGLVGHVAAHSASHELQYPYQMTDGLSDMSSGPKRIGDAVEPDSAHGAAIGGKARQQGLAARPGSGDLRRAIVGDVEPSGVLRGPIAPVGLDYLLGAIVEG
jgi:hypothetical protein